MSAAHTHLCQQNLKLFRKKFAKNFDKNPAGFETVGFKWRPNISLCLERCYRSVFVFGYDGDWRALNNASLEPRDFITFFTIEPETLCIIPSLKQQGDNAHSYQVRPMNAFY